MKKICVISCIVAMCVFAGCNLHQKQLYKTLEEAGYGQGVDWSAQTDDDPSVPKAMDVTKDKTTIEKTYRDLYGDKSETGDLYEKTWWEYIPDNYDLSGEVFPATVNYAGEEKKYNNGTMQSVISDGYTSGQLYDMSTIQTVADSFIYLEAKYKYNWTADIDKLCEIADDCNVADFYVRTSVRPIISSASDGHEISPSFLTAKYNARIMGYDLIGIPQYGGYEFTITVWEDEGELVGWKNDHLDGSFMYEKEIYENMGEWDFYDNVEAAGKGAKVVKPDLPNGVKMYRGETDNLSKEQYVLNKFGGGGGLLYYYGNGITVDMTYFGKARGSNFDDALAICRKICGNR